ncbi:hypothetical protein F4805DRAFT_192260 [Annulohypoxylon moriforme]|nr:hypothetical protein F4805DRAFT_192260 [Annulohypoxylon moriforme]
MDALLNLDSPRGNYVCSSIREIQDKLHHSLISKSSDTRAEHTSLTFEFRHNTVFHLNADADNNNPDGAIDPAIQSQQQPVARSVNVSETVQSQPADDPVLQRAVAKHIVGAMGVIDSSSWVVRQVSRGAQGWTFTYICKDSLQAWNRANGKNTEKPTIASYSGPGSLDPTNLAPPSTAVELSRSLSRNLPEVSSLNIIIRLSTKLSSSYSNSLRPIYRLRG